MGCGKMGMGDGARVERIGPVSTRDDDWPDLAIRAEATETGYLVSGLAAPYGETITYAGVRERIEPGAFAAVLGGKRDVLGLLDHNVYALLGRVSAGTLALRDTVEGLAFQLRLRQTPQGLEIYEQVRRGEMGGVSIGFKETTSRFVERGGVKVWTEIDLFETSLITPFSAYKLARVEVGGLSSERETLREWLAVRDWRL